MQSVLSDILRDVSSDYLETNRSMLETGNAAIPEVMVGTATPSTSASDDTAYAPGAHGRPKR